MLVPLLLSPLLPRLVAGIWTTSQIDFEGNTRSYKKYVPSSSGVNSGLMVFLHGQGGSFDVSSDYQVDKYAEIFGFVGIVPNGTPMGGSGYEWNIDIEDGPNEVSFIHAVIEEVATTHNILAGTPKIALGFSNGAGLSSLLGCYDSSDLYVAHVGVQIKSNADFPSTCGGFGVGGKRLRRRDSTVNVNSTWNAVGDQDFFIDSLEPTPVEGLLNQFLSLRDASGCLQEDPSETFGAGFTCYSYASCPELGQLCVYDNTPHVIRESMTPNAWAYLSASGVQYNTCYDQGWMPVDGCSETTECCAGEGQCQNSGPPAKRGCGSPSPTPSPPGPSPPQDCLPIGEKCSDDSICCDGSVCDKGQGGKKCRNL
eukprot:CAMPEP_0183309686 /NCGR_PEP_ID=MMETSP0160_2-20130417/25485_1 /TAXON_ID=2839 ORGANISM="Odontella Sinensis, Strain Grunow 1884" /NCGR_SAMPLE_ID=MMETSP0160_2 /ASSEMBLY_ACC=CAM_ASM_000250 /LENGTH=367 /DNA_ID=CAMNT_0025473747 /DNA_START=15 /DNA_END=1118 /DNA_ORIENTATION=-